MSLAAKRRVVVALLAGLAVWPLAHRVIVAQTRLSPWRLFGWAMYCTPKLPVFVEVTALRGEQRTAITTAGDRPLRSAVTRFARRRGLWGTFASPQRLAAQALAATPGADAVEIAVEHLYLDPATARIASQRYVYVYSRPPAES